MKRLTILFHGRFPSEKAAAVFVAENARALSSYYDVTIVAPARRSAAVHGPHAEYGLPAAVRVVYLPTIDLFGVPVLTHVAFITSLVAFSVSCLWYLRNAGREEWIESNDLLVGIAAACTRARLFYEVHDFPERWHPLYRWLFARSARILATNQWKYDALRRAFPEAGMRIVMERNGVDLTAFSGTRQKEEARRALGLPLDKTIAVYTGHLYGWKGTDLLADTGIHMPECEFYFVGGTERDITRYRKEYTAENMHFVGHVLHEEVPIWQAAADMLIIPNTAHQEISTHYTSPMKLFEYMASERPIIASNLPSILEVVDDSTAFLFEADSSAALRAAIEQVIADPSAAQQRAQEARRHVSNYAWKARAARLHANMESSV